MIREDLTGRKFGRLTVLERDEKRKDRTFWICKCNCGNIISIYITHLKTGSTKSCGCLRKELFSQKTKKHGMARTKIYRVYQGMLERCYYKQHKTYDDYGGRGITVCLEWNNKENGFENFYSWALENRYEEGLTLERLNNNGEYSPENCSWITRQEQGYNKRNTVKIEINGEIDTLKGWSERLNIKLSTLRDRYYRKVFP